jgi:hypothetical protein
MKTNPSDRQAQQLRRLRAELVRLRARQLTLRGRISGASAIDGSRSGELGRQRKAGGAAPSPQRLQQEQETVEKQIAATQQYIARLEAQLAPASADAADEADKVDAAGEADKTDEADEAGTADADAR